MPTLGELAGEPEEGKRWVKGQGFQPASASATKPKPVFWKPSDLFLDARTPDFGLYLKRSECEEIGSRFHALHRPRSPKIYCAPLVLVNQGCSRFTFSDFDVLFQDSLQSIAGPKKDENLLLFLTALLNSPLATYYLFHTSANWGVEREKVHFEELLQLPFPLPKDTANAEESGTIIREIGARLERAKSEMLRHGDSDAFRIKMVRTHAIKETTELVYRYFDLTPWERDLVEDTCLIFEPSATPKTINSSIPTLESTELPDRKIYAELLCKTINRWASRSPYALAPSAAIAAREGLALLTLEKVKKSEARADYQEHNAAKRLNALIERIARASVQDGLGGLRYLRGFALFEDHRVHILKPLARRHWTRTAALNDADEVADFIANMGNDD